MGHVYDAEHLKGMALNAAYPLTYSSWKNRKNQCKAKGWPWATEWETFPGFLKSMGPRPSAEHTLHRIDNDVHAYGPGLCKWADKFEQNTHRGDNIAIVDPATGEIWTSHKSWPRNKRCNRRPFTSGALKAARTWS